jgi:hypothetical protein
MRGKPPFDASTLLSIDPEPGRRVDFAQGHGHGAFEFAQALEPVERPAELQRGLFRGPRKLFAFFGK